MQWQNAEYYQCDHCHGIWADIYNLDKIKTKRKNLPAVNLEAHTVHHIETESVIRCPVYDHADLKRIEIEGIHLDICNHHRGVWFDRDELDNLLELYRNKVTDNSYHTLRKQCTEDYNYYLSETYILYTFLEALWLAILSLKP